MSKLRKLPDKDFRIFLSTVWVTPEASKHREEHHDQTSG